MASDMAVSRLCELAQSSRISPLWATVQGIPTLQLFPDRFILEPPVPQCASLWVHQLFDLRYHFFPPNTALHSSISHTPALLHIFFLTFWTTPGAAAQWVFLALNSGITLGGDQGTYGMPGIKLG